MEQEKSKNTLIAVLICIIILLVIVCILLASGTINLKGKEEVDNTTKPNTTDTTKTKEPLKITNLSFSKPWVGNLHGSSINTLIITVTANIDCTDDTYAGVIVSGYCLDKNDNKYFFEGPEGVMAIYCDNNENHQNAYSLELTKVLDNNGKEVNTDNIDYKNIEIKYCKIDNATVISTDGSSLNTPIEINYEKEFK